MCPCLPVCVCLCVRACLSRSLIYQWTRRWHDMYCDRRDAVHRRMLSGLLQPAAFGSVSLSSPPPFLSVSLSVALRRPNKHGDDAAVVTRSTPAEADAQAGYKHGPRIMAHYQGRLGEA